MMMRTGLGAMGIATGLVLAGCTTTAPTRDALVADPSACAAKRFDIYFGENQSVLTDAARSAIGLTATQLQGCRIQAVRVLGLSSGTGAAEVAGEARAPIYHSPQKVGNA